MKVIAVVTVILIIALINIALGFSLAVYLEYREFQISVPLGEVSVEQAFKIPDLDEMLQTEEEDEEDIVLPGDNQEAVPQEWLDMLGDEDVIANSFVEASIQVLKLEVGKYRDELIRIEEQIRLLAEGEQDKVDQLLTDLKNVNEDWMAKQSNASEHLSSRRGDLGDYEEVGGGLEDVLLDQQAQVETTCSNLECLDTAEDLSRGCIKIRQELCRLIDLAHLLRDAMQESMVTVMRSENRLESMDPSLHVDGQTGLPNRSGIEVMFMQWWKEDITRQRQLSVVQLDIDHFAAVNQKYATKVGDQLLAAFGKVTDELLNKERDTEAVCRLDGQSLLLFFGDTGPRNATAAVERIRQIIAASTFEYAEDEIELTASCAVVEVGKSDTLPQILKKLKQAIRLAKKSGRNQTAIDEGDGPKIADPPKFSVKGRIMRLDEQPA